MQSVFKMFLIGHENIELKKILKIQFTNILHILNLYNIFINVNIIEQYIFFLNHTFIIMFMIKINFINHMIWFRL
jgi:hypothetical protein